MESPLAVSVLCTAYNHEKYIRSALEGFVSQRTNFKFEVIIHDDASTDGTASIIREYERKYPDIIKPIYQTENQYSKKVGITRSFLYPVAKGKYFAICEGDDYWIDPLKLQKQFDQLEKHPEIDICAHSAILVRDGVIFGFVSPRKENCVIPVEDVIEGGGGFVATASLMIRRENALKLPEYQKIMSLDYVSQIKGSLPNGMLFLKDLASVYRLNAVGSWTSRMSVDSVKYGEHIKKINLMLSCLNQETRFVYDMKIKRHIRENECAVLFLQNECKRIKNEYPDLYSGYGVRKKAIVSSYVVSPCMGKIIRFLDSSLSSLSSYFNKVYKNWKYRKFRSLLRD